MINMTCRTLSISIVSNLSSFANLGVLISHIENTNTVIPYSGYDIANDTGKLISNMLKLYPTSYNSAEGAKKKTPN